MDKGINILLVDDELPALENLKDIAEDLLPTANIFACDNHIDAFNAAKDNPMSIAVLDVEIPGITGVELGKRLKEINPKINIIFATAHDSYAFDASQLFSSGYVLKPISREQMQEQFRNLRYPLTMVERKLEVRCFGFFEVYYKGRPLQFERQKSKELLAYLVDRCGASATVGEIVSVLYEDSFDEQKNRQNLYSAWHALKKALKSINFEEVLIHSQNAYAINTSAIDCDYYKYLKKDETAIHSFRGEYMHQYSWAEYSFNRV